MFKRKEIIKILNQAQHIDAKYELFGASTHQYRLNPPISESFVRNVETQYGFTLPEEYFQFITEIGDGGAGPDYGIRPFTNILIKGSSPGAEKFREAYRYSLANSFTPRKMRTDEVEEYAIATRKAYEQNPDRYFIYKDFEHNDLNDTDGFFFLGTHGCQWDFGLITSGERRGQVFDTDNEGAYCFVSYNFNEFYQNWLNRISDTERFQQELEERREIRRKIRI